MARIALFNIGAHGHINPTLPVVAELVQRGHTVLYYTMEPFRPQIERTGADFRPYPDGASPTVDIGALVGNLVQVTRFLFDESLRLLPFAIAELSREQPNLVIFDAIALWGMQAAHLLGLRSAASIGLLVLEGVSGLMTWRDYVHMGRRALPILPGLLRRRRQLVQTYGPSVFPNKAVFPCLGDTNIVFTSRAFQPDTLFITDSFHFVGPSIAPSTRASTDFPWEALVDDRPRIYVSLGTLHNNSAFYRTAFAAFADHPGQFVFSVGHTTDVGTLGSIPANCIVRSSVPQLELLSRVDLFVTHGGMNSVSEGLYYGVTLVVVPQQLEQALNGRQAARQGAAVVVGDTPSYGQVDAATLRTAVDRVLVDESYAQNAATIGRSFHAAGGYQRAADLLIAALRVVET